MLWLNFKQFSFNHVMLIGPHYWLLENQSIFTNESRNAMVLTYYYIYDFFLNLFRSNSWDHAPFFTSYTEKGRNWLNPVYSWNKQLAHTPFPKKSNTPITTLRFIGFVAKISVLNPKLPADGQWPGETKESVTFFIWSPLIDKRLKNRTSFFVVLLDLFPISKLKMDSKSIPFHNAFSFSIEISNKNKTYSNSIRYRAAGFSCKLWNTSFVAPFPKKLSLD